MSDLEVDLVDYTAATISVREDYGDAWRLIVKPTDTLAGRPYTAVFSPTGNPLDPAHLAFDLEQLPHSTEATWFYVGQPRALGSGHFRVVTADGDAITVLKGTLTVS